MAKENKPKFDFAKLLEDLQRQFQNLDPKDPSLWPVLPRALLCVLIAAGVATFLWFFKLTDYEQELTAERSTEQTLREDYQKKLVKAVSLDALKKQREQIQQYVIQLEKQLPSKRKCLRYFQILTRQALAEVCSSNCFVWSRLWLRIIMLNYLSLFEWRASTTTWGPLHLMLGESFAHRYLE